MFMNIMIIVYPKTKTEICVHFQTKPQPLSLRKLWIPVIAETSLLIMLLLFYKQWLKSSDLQLFDTHKKEIKGYEAHLIYKEILAPMFIKVQNSVGTC